MVLIAHARVCLKVPLLGAQRAAKGQVTVSRPKAVDSLEGTPQRPKGDVVRSGAIIDSCSSSYNALLVFRSRGTFKTTQ